jgi:hypothetical protein
MITDPRLKSSITAKRASDRLSRTGALDSRRLRLDEIDACTLPSQAGGIRLENVGDPKYTMGTRGF